MKMKRAGCLALAAALAVTAALSGCGGAKKTDAKYNYKTTDLGTDPVTLTLVTTQGSSNGLSALKEGFEAEYPNVTVEIVTNYASADLSHDLQSGHVDLYMGAYEYEFWGAGFWDLWEQYAVDFRAEDLVDLTGFNTDLLGALTRDGHTYALPLVTGSVGMLTNMDLLKECGIETAPQTTEELLAACATIKAHGYQPFRCRESTMAPMIHGMTEYEVCKDGKNEEFAAAALAADDAVGD